MCRPYATQLEYHITSRVFFNTETRRIQRFTEEVQSQGYRESARSAEGEIARFEPWLKVSSEEKPFEKKGGI